MISGLYRVVSVLKFRMVSALSRVASALSRVVLALSRVVSVLTRVISVLIRVISALSKSQGGIIFSLVVVSAINWLASAFSRAVL